MACTDTPLPAGTECRVWPRAYLAAKGYKEYAVELQPRREVARFVPVMRKWLATQM